DENSKKAGGIQPGELSEHGTPVAWTAVECIPMGVDIIDRVKSVTSETAKSRWERHVLEPSLAKSPERAASFTTISGHPVDRVYTPEDLSDVEYGRDLGDPGVFPYTRGIHPSGYRGKL